MPAIFRHRLRQGERILAVLLFLSICVPLTLPTQAVAKLPVFVSILPMRYFTERIGGEFVDVSVMVQPGASPATYEPKPRQMAALSGAALYLAVGAPFEQAWLPRIQAANPAMRVAHVDAGIQKLPMAAHHHEEEETEHADTAGHAKHEHDGLDPHIWLSPMLAKPMAQTIRRELSKADPAHAPVFRANFATLEKEIDAFDMELHDLFESIPPEQRTFMVFHPSWGYFAMNYNLRQIPIEFEGKEPTPRILQELMEEASEHGIRTIFVQPQFARKSAQAIADHMQGTVITADPLAEDWFDNLRTVARAMAASFTR